MYVCTINILRKRSSRLATTWWQLGNHMATSLGNACKLFLPKPVTQHQDAKQDYEVDVAVALCMYGIVYSYLSPIPINVSISLPTTSNLLLVQVRVGPLFPISCSRRSNSLSRGDTLKLRVHSPWQAWYQPLHLHASFSLLLSSHPLPLCCFYGNYDTIINCYDNAPSSSLRVTTKQNHCSIWWNTNDGTTTTANKSITNTLPF